MKWNRFMGAAVLAGLCLGVPAFAGEDAGMVKTSKGQVGIERVGQWIPAPVGTPVLVADRIKTGADGAVGVTLRDNTLLSAGANSTLVVNRFAFNSTTHAGAVDATLKRGTLAVVSGKIAKASPENVSYKTPTVSLGVRGTEFIIETSEQESEH